jgi:hypothetical protein
MDIEKPFRSLQPIWSASPSPLTFSTSSLMRFHNNLRQHLLSIFRLLLPSAFVLLLGYSAAAQNAPTPLPVPTGDRMLYARHSVGIFNAKQSQGAAQTQALTLHERKIGRRQYQNQHRSEFPCVYQPGIE